MGASEFILSGGALVIPHQLLTVPRISGQPSSAWRCPKPIIPALDRYNLGIWAQGNAFLGHAHLACLPALLSEHTQGCNLLRDMGHSCWRLQPPYLPALLSWSLGHISPLFSLCPLVLLRDFVLLRSMGYAGSVSISGPQNPLLSCVFSLYVSLAQAPGFPHPGPTPGPRQEPCVGDGVRPSDILFPQCLETVLCRLHPLPTPQGSAK